jgi:GNAT superfamily N-acetyltransferase
VIIREATVSDAGALARVHVRSWQEAYRGLVPQEYLDGMDPARRLPRWQEMLADDDIGLTLVAEDERDGVVGFIRLSPSRDTDVDPSEVGEVQAVYLLAGYWGRGVGRSLMDAGVRRLVAAGFRELTLWVLATNERARRFYEAAGWRADGSAKSDDSRGFALDEVRYRRH